MTPVHRIDGNTREACGGGSAVGRLADGGKKSEGATAGHEAKGGLGGEVTDDIVAPLTGGDGGG